MTENNFFPRIFPAGYMVAFRMFIATIFGGEIRERPKFGVFFALCKMASSCISARFDTREARNHVKYRKPLILSTAFPVWQPPAPGAVLKVG